jgi:hypothetical protein
MNKAILPIAMLAAVSLSMAAQAQSPLAARDRFDGRWSVVVMTRGGTCAPSYRYQVEIINGVVTPGPGAPAASVAGRVTPRGQVSVSVRQGDEVGLGTGRLTGNVGEGQWSGRSPNQTCTGYWQAQRFG